MSFIVSMHYSVTTRKHTNLRRLTPMAFRAARKIVESALNELSYTKVELGGDGDIYNFARPFPFSFITTRTFVPFTAECYADFGCLIVTT